MINENFSGQSTAGVKTRAISFPLDAILVRIARDPADYCEKMITRIALGRHIVNQSQPGGDAKPPFRSSISARNLKALLI
jgi:hypothetical protein